jgi:hypothetical protein
MPFDRAKEGVEAWLDGQGAAFVTRVTDASMRGRPPAWKLTVNHPKFPDGWVKIVLPRDFPASPAEIRVDPSSMPRGTAY